MSRIVPLYSLLSRRNIPYVSGLLQRGDTALRYSTVSRVKLNKHLAWLAHQEFGKEAEQKLVTKVLSLIGEVAHTSHTSFWIVSTSSIQRHITRVVLSGLQIHVSDDIATTQGHCEYRDLLRQ